ncbi:MAG: S-layer homology domain-containing protein [Clostridia bacterium]|nr:S-layer homology domain-containing protein [Clostridia bacterium]
MKKMVRFLVAVLVFALCLPMLGISGAAQAAEQPVLSYGLCVLAAGTDVAVSAPIGNDVLFSADCFARGLNLPRVEYITVKSLPDPLKGELLLGSTRVAAGQTVSGGNLALMNFSPATEDYTQASFTFTANGGSVPMICNVYLTGEINYTPTVSMASGLSLNQSTYENLELYGTLSGYDPDGDTLIFEVVSYPRNGSVLLLDRNAGKYVYRPSEGYVGTDSFSYIVRDRYGNYSASATVDLKITKSGSTVTYADMQGTPSYRAALAMTDAGIMSGTQIGDKCYFYPDRAVSRIEFLVMAMNAIGIYEVPACEQTVFADDGEIADSMKGYVAAAYDLGYVSGTLENGTLCFLPNNEITRAEAAVMLSNLVGLCEIPVIPTFSDGSDIPVWARESIYSLNAAGIMVESEGCISPTATLTRADTAEMLFAVMQYVEK